MHQKPRIPPRPKEDGVSCCMMDEDFVSDTCAIVLHTERRYKKGVPCGTPFLVEATGLEPTAKALKTA